MMRDYRHIIIGLVCTCGAVLAVARQMPSSAIVNHSLEVTVTGLPAKPLKNVFQRLKSQQQLIKSRFKGPTIRRFYDSIPAEIKIAIQPYGYFKPNIRSSLGRSTYMWQARFSVIPGPRLRFTKVSLQINGAGRTDPAFQRLYQRFAVKAGRYFNSERYEKAKQTLFDVAAARGYFSAKMVKSEITVNLKSYQSRVIIVFDTGPRYRFGRTTFSKTLLNDDLLQRFLRYRQGQYFKRRQVQRTRQGLSNSNYFSTVIVNPEPNGAKQLQVPVKVRLSMQPKKQYTVGAGFGTDTGPRLTAGLDVRYLNRYGHHFNTYLRAAQINSIFSLNYFIPGTDPVISRYLFTAAYLDQKQPTGEGRGYRFGAGYQTVVYGWQQSIMLNYLKERYNINNFPRTSAEMLYPSISWERRRTNKDLSPSSGYSVLARINAASDSVLSTSSLLQERVDSRFLFTLWKRTRFLWRASVGHTDIKNLEKLPLSLQFFAGGAQSIRGYGFNRIGPGRDLFVGSVEIQQQIKGPFYLAGFIDFGNVSDNLTSEKLKRGAGPALVLLTPVGMFELSFARALGEQGDPWMIQFSMGASV